VAQRVIGIDLGTYAVKVAAMEVGFRSSRLVRLDTYPVPAGPASPLERSLGALAEMTLTASDVVVVAVPGDRVLLRLLQIPFTEPKKLGAVVGNELADEIPWELEEVVFDYTAAADAPGRVLAAAARTDEVRMLLGELAERRIDPRAIAVGPLCYGGIVRQSMPEGTAAVLDIGHTSTNLCYVINGRVAAARSISRGGHQVTDALRQALQLSYAEAEELKEREGCVAQDGEALPPPRQQIAAAVAGALAPVVREVRLTMGLLGTELGRRADQLLLCGGTSLLEGLEPYLEAELQVPTRRLQVGAVAEPGDTVLTVEGEAMAAAAMGIAIDQGGRRNVDLRQGEFAYKTDRSVFTEKLVHVAVSLVTILVFAALSAYMSLYSLRKEEKALGLQLKQATQQVLGEVLDNPRAASRLVKRGCRPRAFGIPKKTAFDILDTLSREIPGADKIKLDIIRLDIKPGKTYLKGTADTRSAVDDIVKGLEKNPCFSKVTSGKISDVSDGKKQFTLTMDTECF